MGAVAGLAKWGNPSGPSFDRVWPALVGAETSAASVLRRTIRSPRQTQLMEIARCWTRRCRYGAGGGILKWRRCRSCGDVAKAQGVTLPSWRRRVAGAGVGISPRPGAGCPTCTSPRPGTGRASGRRLEEKEKPLEDVHKARALGADGGVERPELRRCGDGARKTAQGASFGRRWWSGGDGFGWVG